MTDRELLEMAARAAGNGAHWDDEYQRMQMDYSHKGGTNFEEWNPLTDDGDALRLAVRLGILLRTDFIKRLTVLFCTGISHAEATRQAITVIAAEIGRNMP